MFVVAVIYPLGASAMTQEDVRSEFSVSELGRLFERTASYGDCDFIMHDFSAGDDVYLRVRDAYRSRYDEFVGNDSADILSEDDGLSVQSDSNGNPLVEIADTQQEPWCDMLRLSIGLSEKDMLAGNVGSGSAFMASKRVALTAAHCVYGDGNFYFSIQGVSGYDADRPGYSWRSVSKALIQREWADKAVSGASYKDMDRGHDFAVLIFDRSPSGADGGQFSIETISIADSLSYLVCNAGYARKEGDSAIRAWKSQSYVAISKVNSDGAFGNVFQTSLGCIKGMSGGPVYRNGKSEGVPVVGIHIAETALGFSRECRITERLQVLVAWSKASGYENIKPSGSGTSGASPSTGGSAFELAMRSPGN